jgi:hypothetical protein
VAEELVDVEKIVVKEVHVPFDVYVDNIVVKEVVQEVEIERLVIKEVEVPIDRCERTSLQKVPSRDQERERRALKFSTHSLGGQRAVPRA